MFEFFIALKYLMPGKKRFAASLISLMSIGVISLVVWLVLVFLSVINGIEENWINKLTSLNAPLRITPTDHYYSSYYYLSDSISMISDYNTKNIREKQNTEGNSNPYKYDTDMEIPQSWAKPHLNKKGELVDPVKIAFGILSKHQDIAYEDYELSASIMKIAIQRENKNLSFLTQMIYLAAICEKNPHIKHLLLPPSNEDINNFNKNLSQIDKEKLHSALPTSLSVTLENNIEPVFLPKSLKDSGICVGDRGYLSYNKNSSFTHQEQHISIYVAGFYDPGLLPIGNKCVLVNPNVTQMINKAAAVFSPDGTPMNGIYVWMKDPFKAKKWKSSLEQEFINNDIAQYWKITDFSEYEFAKDLLQQFQSDKMLFSLIAIIILIVACSSIISMLILLVNDKKREIAAMQAMGASKKNIAIIFGICGVTTGLISSIIGILAALFTLNHLDVLVDMLSAIQGHAAFNVMFFGNHLPNTLSIKALLLILIATPIISLIAGIIPAIKATKLSPSNILRSE